MKSQQFTANDFMKLRGQLTTAEDNSALYKEIVNSPFGYKEKVIPLGLGVVVLLLVNKQQGTLDRIALSETEPAQGAQEYSVKEFHEIKIPLKAKENLLIRAIETGKNQATDDWQYLFIPELTAEEARFNQAGAGIGCSIVYPLTALDGGAMIFSYFLQPSDITQFHHDFMKGYVALVNDRLSS